MIDSIVDDPKGILIRHLGDFYFKASNVYCSIPCAEDPASKDKVRDVCSLIFEEVKQRVSYHNYLLVDMICEANQFENVADSHWRPQFH